MQGLIVHMPMAMVGFHQLAMTWPTWESFTHTPPPLEGKVHFRYDGAYDSERVLITSGSATIVPDVTRTDSILVLVIAPPTYSLLRSRPV